jgi:hypothetical protein
VVAGRVGGDPQIVLGTCAHLLPHSGAMGGDAVAAAIIADKLLTNEPKAPALSGGFSSSASP